MAVITLTTDMGDRDYYVAALKGAVLRRLPDARLIDISHKISPFDIAQASFVIRNVYREFPEGTIHIIGINPDRVKRLSPFDMRDEVKHVIVEKEGHYFIGADNGIFSLLFDEAPERIFEITVDTGYNPEVFPVKNVFIPIACDLAQGKMPEELGFPMDSIHERAIFRPVVEQNMIKGTVIYIDTYGNVITNITRDLFEKIKGDRDFTLYFRSEDYEITEISGSYGEVPEGEKVALFGSSGHLEIAINRGVEGSGGGASSLFGLKLNDTIRIEFQ
ncbi:MAG: SAM-dependent chlorinase/fluorinase [Flavobacteriales bacterium]|nr:SAM-dependent chlorinase/fluorinase [Flavobacteriales bacterium]